MKTRACRFALVLTLAAGLDLGAQTILIPATATWKYSDQGIDLGTGWRSLGFDDTGWEAGAAELGYGDSDETTLISYGPDSANKYATYYFRHVFNVDEPSAYGSLPFELVYDDGALLYLNGVEVHRVGMPLGDIVFSTYASSATDYTPDTGSIPADLLVAGTNILAAEVHQCNATSSDLSFRLQLAANTKPSVALTAPTNNQSFLGPLDLLLTADASDSDGTVVRVEFYVDGQRIGADNTSPYSLLWTNVPENIYTLTVLATDNAGAQRLSSPVTIGILDPNPPALASILAYTNRVFVTFSKRVVAPSALALTNYSIASGVEILGSSFGTSEAMVVLETTLLQEELTYTLTINHVGDARGLPVAPDTQRTFAVIDFLPLDIGSPPVPGSLAPEGEGYALTGSGADIGGTADQFFFAYKLHAGDFDLKVRLASLTLSDAWAEAGLMARETLNPDARFASVLATPGAGISFFVARVAIADNAITTGTFPVNYPYTWLRLQRAGTVLTGFASWDGDHWQRLGATTLTNLPQILFLGQAVASHSAAAAAATFRDVAPVSGGTVGTIPLPREPLGPSSRNIGVVISEVMYHPQPVDTNDNLEFIELYNADLIYVDLSGYRLSGDIDYIFPDQTILNPGAFQVVAAAPADLESVYGTLGALGPYTNTLPDGGGLIRLRDPQGAVKLEINYRDIAPWPVAADGAGHSMVLARPSHGEDDPRAWAESDAKGGSPGRMDPYSPEPAGAIVINEFLAHTDDPLPDFIELYNHSHQDVDVSGCFLTDDRSTNKYQIGPNTVIRARGFLALSQGTLGFALSSSGESIYFVNSNNTRVLDAVVFDGQANGVSTGRYPDGAPTFHELAAPTGGSANAPLLIRGIVINEIMYHPLSEDDNDEYVELHNRGALPVNVGNWRLTDGIEFTIPPNTTIPPQGYLVVARSAARLLANYSQLNSGNTLGDFGGRLANDGERLVLSMPEPVVTTNASGRLETNFTQVVVDEVTYDDGGRWGTWADGGGSSLELIDPNSDHRLAPNWAESDETAKSEWTNFLASDYLDHVYMRNATGAALNEVQVMILGAGEALMDDVSVQAAGSGANVVANPSFDTGLTNWVIQGNHVDSSLEPAGALTPSPCLRLRATGGGDNGANRVECDLTTALLPGTNATLGARLRWLHGHRDVLLRLHGGGLEAAVTLPVPANLGSPGLPNSRLVANAGPAICSVNHSPAVPTANEDVVVTARLNDPDGIAVAELQYRLDPATDLATILMRDDGAGGDAVESDGTYSTIIPGHPAGTTVAFQIRVWDAHTPSAATSFPADAPTRECLVRFGDPPSFGTLGVYRIWMTSSNLNIWSAREKLSNQAQDGTFVYNDHRVIYNAGARYRGSPFIRPGYNTPTGAACGYVWTFPEDDLFLGEDEVNLDSLEPSGRDSTALREFTSFTMLEQLGLQWSYQRFVHVVINGVNDTSRSIPVYSDSQQPNSSYISTWFPDNPDGEIFKIDDWFEFTDAVGMDENKSASLENFVGANGAKKQARYRWNWEKKSNRGLNDDYSSLYAAVDALNAADAVYVARVGSVLEVEQWLTMLAYRHVLGDWDGYGYNRGKNQFIYRPPGGKFHMLMWDLDFSLGCNSGHSPSQDLFSLSLDGATGQNHMPEVSRMYNHPYFRRVYLQALQRIAAGPLQPSSYAPILEARYRALQANQVNSVSPYVASGAQSISIPAWIDQRRNHIFTQIQAQTNATFGITSNGGNDFTTSSNLVTLSGTAPLLVQTLEVNGVPYPVTWTTVTAWQIRVPILDAQNLLTIQGKDLHGQPLATASDTVNVTYTGPLVAPEENLVINEIMYNPAKPKASFVEILNRSGVAFDLSNWRLDGIDYLFPLGSLIGPGQAIVLAKDWPALASAFGTNTLVFGEFDGTLNNRGETLALVKPGPTPAEDVIVDQVRYEDLPPWPSQPDGQGPSLQLIDPTQDNSRVSNWSDSAGWRFFSYTGIIGVNILRLFLNGAGDLYLDNISVVTGAVAQAGVNLVANGDFEQPFASPWSATGNHATSDRSSAFAFAGDYSLHIVATGFSSGGSVVQQTLSDIDTTNTYTMSFWFLATTNASTLTARFGTRFRPAIDVQPLPTPGAPNTNVLASLPPYPEVWLNEVQPDNINGLQDQAGDFDPWLELYNAGNTPINLENLALTDNYTNLAQWTFPAETTLLPKEFKIVWIDGEPGETSVQELHTSFRAQSGTGSIALTRILNDGLQILDYLNYSQLGPGLSYGSYPEGQPFRRQTLFPPSPGTTNLARAVNLFFNEWMAQNNNALSDPADGDHNDWIELYNPGPEAVDLQGFFLTDDLQNHTKFRIPAGYLVPAAGFLLVWADEETSQNNSNRLDLHVNFRLAAEGETLGLYTPEGVAVDEITFGPQTSDISQGRYPDGTPTLEFMPRSTPGAPNDIAVPAPQLAISKSGGQVSLTLTATVGKTYRVEFKNNLNESSWQPLGSDLLADGGRLTVTHNIGSDSQRFYRIIQLD